LLAFLDKGKVLLRYVTAYFKSLCGSLENIHGLRINSENHESFVSQIFCTVQRNAGEGHKKQLIKVPGLTQSLKQEWWKKIFVFFVCLYISLSALYGICETKTIRTTKLNYMIRMLCTTEEPSAAEEPVENVQGYTWLDDDIQQLKDFGKVDVLQVDTATQLYDSDL